MIDSSPLILLSKAGALDLPAALFEEVVVPEAVRAEVVEGAPDAMDAQAVDEAIQAGRLQLASPPAPARERIEQRYPNLGPGERGCLALAPSTDGAVAVADDAQARRAARIEGVEVIGCLAIVALAYRQGAVSSKSELAGVLTDLLRSGLWVSPELVETFWTRLGGRP